MSEFESDFGSEGEDNDYQNLNKRDLSLNSSVKQEQLKKKVKNRNLRAMGNNLNVFVWSIEYLRHHK